MWNYEKTFTISRKNYPDQSEDGPGNHQSVRWTGWRISCVHALFITEVHHAVQRSDRNFNRYWHRGISTYKMEVKKISEKYAEKRLWKKKNAVGHGRFSLFL